MRCEALPIQGPPAPPVGTLILITAGEGKGLKATVVDSYVYAGGGYLHHRAVAVCQTDDSNIVELFHNQYETIKEN